MPQDTAKLDRLKWVVTRELFLNTADQTYIVARWCFLNSLYLDFYLNGVHAVEKFLKASLLMNGRSAMKNAEDRAFQHDIVRLFEAVRSYAAEFFPKALERPEALNIAHWADERTTDFVERLNGLGDPNNRYNVFGFVQRPEDLYKLDLFVYAARRVAVCLDAPSVTQRNADNGPSPSFADLLRRSPDFQPHDVGSTLAKLTGPKATDEVRRAALNHNLPFAPDEFEHQQRQSSWSASNSVLGLMVLNPAKEPPSPDDSVVADLADWAVENISLPKDAKAEIRRAGERLRRRSGS